jgi:hypothetical protein
MFKNGKNMKELFIAPEVECLQPGAYKTLRMVWRVLQIVLITLAFYGAYVYGGYYCGAGVRRSWAFATLNLPWKAHRPKRRFSWWRTISAT